MDDLYGETITLPRAVRFPVELRPPTAFDPERPQSWPRLAGRLEYVEGRLLYMPPCGEVQAVTVTDVVITLGAWVRAHPELVLGTNEAGMRLGDAARAADAAIWSRRDVGPPATGLARQPLLAVEVAGEDEPEVLLREKAAWYLDHGVTTVWLVLPETREVVVLERGRDSRHATGLLPPPTALPGLAPPVGDLFVQLTIT